MLPLVFPDGRLLSRRWRPVLWAALLIIPLSAVGRAFIPDNMGSSLNYLPNPYPIPAAEPVFEVMLLLAVGSGLIVLAAVSASVVLRWRRSGQVVRLQLKWFLATIPILVAGIVAFDFFPDPVTMAFGIAGGLLPMAIGVAVLRYRLYEIDVILSRAVLYAALSVVVAVVYLAVVAIAGGVFGVGRSLGVQVLATVIAALALWPLRGRVQRGVQRLFFGDRDAPYAAMARLGRQVEEAGGAESVLGSVAKTVADSLRLPYAAVELRQGKSWVPAAAWGQKPAVVKAFPLVSQRETVGRLLVGQRSPGEQLGAEDERLLEDLARQVGPTAHAVALRARWRHPWRSGWPPGRRSGGGCAATCTTSWGLARRSDARPGYRAVARQREGGSRGAAAAAVQAEDRNPAGGHRRAPHRLRAAAARA